MVPVSEIYDRYAKMIYFTAYGVCHNGETAADVLQIVFMRVMEHERTVMRLSGPQLRSWLFRVAHNAVLDIVKRSRKETPAALEWEAYPADQAEQPEEAYLQKCDAAALVRALESLPDLYRSPIELCYFAELSGKEAAKLLGVKETTLRSRILRGKAMLQSILRTEEARNGSL